MTQATQTELRLARRMSRLGTETAFEVLVKARALEKQGRDIVHLEIGEPDFDTPGHIIEAACEALHRGYTHYGPSAGMPELRQAIADDVAASRGIQVSPEEVVVVPGGKPIMYFIITALVDHGDEVIYPNPGFPIYESMINFVGGTPVPIPLREELDFRLDVKELAGLVNERTKLIILNSPQNPTGGVLTESDIDGIADAVSNCNAMVLSDEIYCRLIFEGFSKTYAMTGWRMGYGMMRRDLADQIARLQTNSNSCTASFTQMAGVAALKGDQSSVGRMRDEFKRRRDYFAERINRIKGFSCKVPKGAFYMFPNITKTGWPSKKLADALLQEAGVATLSGTAFGAYGEGYLRFSIANSLENLRKALDRIDEWTQKRL
jgi:aspartate/methionine/tyrosine aminotransferase